MNIGLVLLFFLSIGGAGMVMGRRHPLLSVPFLCIIVFIGYLGIQFQNDLYAGAPTSHLGKLVYIFSYFAPLASVTMAVVGAVMGMRRTAESSPAWRRISGIVGVPLLGFSTYLSYFYGKSAYYEYYLWPIEKAEDHYVMPLRWQDIVALVGIWSVVISLLVCSIYLLRSSFKTEVCRPEDHQ